MIEIEKFGFLQLNIFVLKKVPLGIEYQVPVPVAVEMWTVRNKYLL